MRLVETSAENLIFLRDALKAIRRYYATLDIPQGRYYRSVYTE